MMGAGTACGCLKLQECLVCFDHLLWKQLRCCMPSTGCSHKVTCSKHQSSASSRNADC